MRTKLILIFTFLSLSACIDNYDINPQEDSVYDSYGNLGFEDGLNHWYGHANTFSSITIESDAYEGLNALKMSINMDTLSSEVALAEISKSVDVTQGDTVSLTFQLRFSADDEIDGVSLFNIGSFQDANGAEIETALDSINQVSTEWQTINMRYPIPQDAVKLFFGVRIEGVHESVYVLVAVSYTHLTLPTKRIV